MLVFKNNYTEQVSIEFLKYDQDDTPEFSVTPNEFTFAFSVYDYNIPQLKTIEQYLGFYFYKVDKSAADGDSVIKYIRAAKCRELYAEDDYSDSIEFLNQFKPADQRQTSEMYCPDLGSIGETEIKIRGDPAYYSWGQNFNFVAAPCSTMAKAFNDTETECLD